MPTIARERLDDGIEVLRLDRPAVRNAIDSAMLAELEAALAQLAADDTLRVLVVSTTSTDALCAGADVDEPLDRAASAVRMAAFGRLWVALEAFPVPVIAVCVGSCVGGGAELATSADLRVGGDNLRLVWPGGRLGVPVGPARLVPLVGLSRAKELVMTGRPVDADEAQALGLLAARAPADEAEDAALELARGLAAHPPEGMRRLKRLFRDLGDDARRVAHEADETTDFQANGPGVPYGGTRGR